MTTYVNVFGGDTIPPSEYAYAAYSISANAELVWPFNFNGSDLLQADILEISATVAGLTLTLPPANVPSVGADFVLRNTGAESIEILDNIGGSLTTLIAGEVKMFYVKDNSDAAGDWGIFDYGAGTSSADASALAGYGMRTWLGKLVPDHSYITKNANYTVVDSDRNKLINVVTGTVTITMPAAATVEAGFHVLIRNSSLGTITVDGDGTENIDGALTKELQPNESAIFVSSGAGWYTVGYGRDVDFTFSEFVINAAAGDVVLSSSDVAGRMIRVSGTAVANIEVTLPAIDNIYFVNVENGMGAFTATFTTGSGDTAVLSANDRTVLYSDGTNVQVALTTALATTLVLNDGSAASPSINFALDPNTGLFRVGANQLGFSADGTLAGSIVPTGFAAINGSAASPSYTFASDINTGFFRNGAEQIGVASNGTLAAVMSAAGYWNVDGSAAAPSYKFLNWPNTGLFLSGNSLSVSIDGQLTATFGNGLVASLQMDTGGGDESPAYSFLDNGAAGLNYLGSGTISLSSGGSGFGEVYISQTKVNINMGNLEFGSALSNQQRIRGDFTDTTASDRVCFQSNVTNGQTALTAIPNGTSTNASLQLRNASDPENAGAATFRVTSTGVDFISTILGTGVLLPMTFNMGVLSETMRIATDGDFEISRFTRIGELGPYIKTKKLTGTTNAAAGGTSSVAHGLTSSKIVGVQVVVGASAGSRVLPGSPIAANAYQVHYDGTNLVVTNGASSGATINNQPFTALVTYEE